MNRCGRSAALSTWLTICNYIIVIIIMEFIGKKYREFVKPTEYPKVVLITKNLSIGRFADVLASVWRFGRSFSNRTNSAVLYDDAANANAIIPSDSNNSLELIMKLKCVHNDFRSAINLKSQMNSFKIKQNSINGIEKIYQSKRAMRHRHNYDFIICWTN